MNFRDNIKIRVDKAAQQVEVKDIEQDVSQLNIDDDEIDEKFSKQQDSQIIESKKSEILCLDFFNVQVQKFISYINKNFMNAFNKTFDKRIDQRVNSTDAKLNVITAQLVAIIEAYATINNQLQQINNRLNELTNKKNSQRLLVDQGFKQKASSKRNDAINLRLFNNEIHNENDSFTESSFSQRKILFSSFSFHESVFYNRAFLDLIEYFSRVSQVFKSLIVEQVNYFDSKKESESSNTVIKISFFFDSMIIVKKHTYYKNVYVFVNRFKNQVKQHDHEQIKNVIYDCLRDDANYWFTYELNDFMKKTLRHASLNSWYSQLITRFKFRAAAIIQELTSQTYNFNKVRIDINSRNWIMHMLRQIRIAELIFNYNQLIMIWNRLDVTLRRDIFESTERIFLRQFMKQIDNKKSIWIEMTERQHQLQNRQQQRYQSSQQQRYQQSYQSNRGINSKSPSRITFGDKGQQVHLTQAENEYEYYNEETKQYMTEPYNALENEMPDN